VAGGDGVVEGDAVFGGDGGKAGISRSDGRAECTTRERLESRFMSPKNRR
jgi:hypothetical protein